MSGGIFNDMPFVQDIADYGSLKKVTDDKKFDKDRVQSLSNPFCFSDRFPKGTADHLVCRAL